MRNSIDLLEEIDSTKKGIKERVRSDRKYEDNRYRNDKAILDRFSKFIREELPIKYYPERPEELRESIFRFIEQDDNQVNSSFLRPFKSLLENIEQYYTGENKRNIKMIRDWIKVENFSSNTEKSSVRFYDQKELEKLFEHSNVKQSAQIRIITETGVKPGVAGLLTKEDFVESPLEVRKQVKQGEGITELPDYRKREIPIERPLIDKIKSLDTDSKFLFGGTALSAKRSVMDWSKLESRVDFEVRAEYLRNTCAALKIQQGVPVDVVARKYLGKKNQGKIERIQTSLENN